MAMDYPELRQRRALVTGGGGFLGSHVVERLCTAGCLVTAPRKCDYDLTRLEAVERLFERERPELVIHCAGVVGGIGANQNSPGSFFYQNAMMGMQLVEACRRYKVKKTVLLGTVCSYPKFTAVPFREDDLWNGYPEETNAPYGIAKKALLVMCQAYRQQYGMNVIYLLPVNLYGPRDNFDLESSHVIPAMIRKCLDAIDSGAGEIVLWGDGSASREFLYVEDAAEGIAAATARYDEPEPANLGSGCEIRIRDLAVNVAEVAGFRGRIFWDMSKPNGQPRRFLDITRAEREFGFRARTSFDAGLRATVEWYRGVRVRARASERKSADSLCRYADLRNSSFPLDNKVQPSELDTRKIVRLVP
jgi:GDP-L-fucose synthase